MCEVFLRDCWTEIKKVALETYGFELEDEPKLVTQNGFHVKSAIKNKEQDFQFFKRRVCVELDVQV